MAAERKRTVVKLGGSLLHTPAWPERLKDWLTRQPHGDYFIVVGGGQLIDALRDLDSGHELSQVEMHWRCIRVLDATYEIAAELIPEFGRIASNEQLSVTIKNRNECIDVQAYWVRVASYYTPEIDSQQGTELKLQHNWNTTSDSLALLLAHRIHADRCVLLKSCDVKQLNSLQQAVNQGVLDPESIRFQSIVPAIEFMQL